MFQSWGALPPKHPERALKDLREQADSSSGLGGVSNQEVSLCCFSHCLSEEQSGRYMEMGELQRVPAPCCIINLILKLVPAA